MNTTFEKSAGHDEWLTPPEIILSLGKFDLDPCAPVNRPWPMAQNHFTKDDDGLKKEWHGRVWCNPPYGSETRAFFEWIWPHAAAVCFIKGRLSFYHVTGEKGGTAGAPSMLVAFDSQNAGLLWHAVARKILPGAFVDLQGARITV